MQNTIPNSQTEGGYVELCSVKLSEVTYVIVLLSCPLDDVSNATFDHWLLVVRLFEMRLDIDWKIKRFLKRKICLPL